MQDENTTEQTSDAKAPNPIGEVAAAQARTHDTPAVAGEGQQPEVAPIGEITAAISRDPD